MHGTRSQWRARRSRVESQRAATLGRENHFRRSLELGRLARSHAADCGQRRRRRPPWAVRLADLGHDRGHKLGLNECAYCSRCGRGHANVSPAVASLAAAVVYTCGLYMRASSSFACCAIRASLPICARRDDASRDQHDVSCEGSGSACDGRVLTTTAELAAPRAY